MDGGSAVHLCVAPRRCHPGRLRQDEIDRAVMSVERDILTAVKLYLSLATLA